MGNLAVSIVCGYQGNFTFANRQPLSIWRPQRQIERAFRIRGEKKSLLPEDAALISRLQQMQLKFPRAIGDVHRGIWSMNTALECRYEATLTLCYFEDFEEVGISCIDFFLDIPNLPMDGLHDKNGFLLPSSFGLIPFSGYSKTGVTCRVKDGKRILTKPQRPYWHFDGAERGALYENSPRLRTFIENIFINNMRKNGFPV